MVFTHGENAAAWQIEFEIGVAAAVRRFDPARRGARLNEPDAPIGALAKNNEACRNRVGAAAIFMHAAAYVKGRRREVRNFTIRPAAAQNRAAILAWPRFEPIEVLAIDAHAAKTNRRPGHELDAHRRDPGAIRGNQFGHWRSGLQKCIADNFIYCLGAYFTPVTRPTTAKVPITTAKIRWAVIELAICEIKPIPTTGTELPAKQAMK